MVAGINGASNSPANKKKTTNVAWSPAPPKEKTLWDDMKKVKKTLKEIKEEKDKQMRELLGN